MTLLVCLYISKCVCSEKNLVFRDFMWTKVHVGKLVLPNLQQFVEGRSHMLPSRLAG